MSSLIFFTRPDVAVIATDTLGVTMNGEPFVFTNKATYLPTIQTVIAGTGVGGFSSAWAEYVNSRMILKDIDNLNVHAQSGLLTMWEKFQAEYNLDKKATTTVYHIGFSSEDGTIKTFVYRSVNNFASETIGYGTAVKPECDLVESENIIDAITQMMNQQKAIQDTKPASERLYIGGEIQVIIIEKDKARFSKIGELPGFKEQMEFSLSQ